MYKLKLSDGSEVSGLTLRDNIFWSDAKIEPEIFTGKLSPVEIVSLGGDDAENDFDGLTGVHAHMELCYVREREGKYALALADIPSDKWNDDKRDADIAYLYLMTGVEM